MNSMKFPSLLLRRWDSNFMCRILIFRFLKLYDGVHTLLHDRTEIGKAFIPDRPGYRINPNHVYGDYSPVHLHHNWRFNDIYEEAKKFEADPNYKGHK